MSKDVSEVNIKFEPFKEIVILDQTFFNSPDEIARFTSVIAGGKLAGLYWAEGVVFLYFPLAPTNSTITRMLIESRKIYWTFVAYAIMPKYVPIIETKEKMIVPVIDISANPMMKKIAKWLIEQK
ncbi:MAG: hypothetical protein GX638_10795 [Crenarchaeota archaeon]|nr:hypothetical protein [Thermoproteota archaeon]